MRMGKVLLGITQIVLVIGLLLATDAAQAESGLSNEGGKKTILFLGDSLTAGLGVRSEEGFPALVAEKIRAAGLPFEIINAGVSGDTSAGGLRRIDWLLQRRIDLLVLELGANDGLRGLSPASLKANLEAIIEKAKAKNPQIKVVIAGMQIPPNLGASYGADFQRVFLDVAREKKAAVIPFLLEGVGGRRDLNQSDMIHPTAAGHKIVAETVWQTIEPLLRPDSTR